MDGGQAMERRAFLVMVSGGIVAAPLATEAQQAGKVVKIGVLHPGSGTQQLFTALAESAMSRAATSSLNAATPKDAWPA